jgi:P27 family predicted phage terminase small subunit
MAGGRPPKPTALKVLEGNPGKRKVNENEPQPAKPESLAPPPWLDEFGLEAWEQLAPELARLGMLTVLDMPLFALSCQLYSLARRSGKATRSLTQRSKANGYVARPQVGQFTQGLNTLRQIWAEFGVTAAARTRLGVVDAEAPEDPAESFLAKKPRRQA